MPFLSTRIRVSGDIAGMLMIVVAGMAIAAVLTFFTNLIKNHVLKNNPKGQKVIGYVNTVIWIGAIVLVILDLTQVTHVIYDLLVALFNLI